MTRQRDSLGFTLIELLVVVAVISLLVMIVVPSMAGLFRSGSTVNARNVVDAQLKATRGLAIRDRQYTGVRLQRGLDGGYWLGIVRYDEKTGQFDLCEATEMVTLPVGIGAGRVTKPFVDDSGKYAAQGIANFNAFTSFTILFGPNGRLVEQANGQNIKYKTSGSKLFTTLPDNWTHKSQYIWDASLAVPERGVRALCLFEAGQLNLYLPEPGETATGDDWDKVADALNAGARFVPVNPYTAGLIRGTK